MNQEKTIADVWPIARAIGQHVQSHHVPAHGGDAKWFTRPHWDGSSYIAAAFAEPGVIEYRVNQHADIRITDIDVAGVKPEDIDVGPIEPAGPQKVVRAGVVGNRNATMDDVPWELEYRDLAAQTALDKMAREVGASLAVGLRTQVGYGNEAIGITGETELSVQAEASFRQAWEREMTAHREHEVTSKREITLRAMHEATLERVETVGPARQVIRARGALKFGCRFHASGEWWVSFDSIADFVALIQGIDAKHTTNNGASWLPFYRAHPVPVAALAPFRQTVFAETEKVREFEEASNVRVDIRSEPLNDGARMADALAYLAKHGPTPELRREASAAMDL